jgi:pilus assembly protein CpaE
VALVDMNLLFGEIPLFLSLEPTHHWGEITKNIGRLDSTFLMKVLSRHSTGIQVLPSPSYLNGHQAATPEIIEHLLALMKTMFDFVVIDGGQSLNDTSLRILEMSDEVLLMSLLSLPCLANTNKLLSSLSHMQYRKKEQVKIVINRYLKKSEVSLKEAEESIHKEIFWTIPNDYKTTMSAINQGKALSSSAPKASISRNLKELAMLFTPHGEKKGRKKRAL